LNTYRIKFEDIALDMKLEVLELY